MLIKNFTKLNLKDIFYYIRIKKGNKEKTAFYIKYNYYKFLIILISLANILITF